MFGWFKKKEPTEEEILAGKMVRYKKVQEEIIECTNERTSIKQKQAALTVEYEQLKKELGHK